MTACSFWKDTNEPKTTIYIALGDSIPAGYGLENPDKDGYVGLFAEQLKEDCIEVTAINMAVSGLTTTQLLESLENLESDDKHNFAHADYITVSIGGNNILGPMIDKVYEIAADLGIDDIAEADILQTARLVVALVKYKTDDELNARFDEGIAVFVEDFNKIMAVLNDIAPNAEIIVSTVYNPIPDNIGISEDAVERITGLNSFIIELQNIYGYTIADTYTAFQKAEQAGTQVTNFNFDAAKGTVSIDIHPNVAGHSVIAEAHLPQSDFNIQILK